jgi:hypothetical protein
MTIKKIGLSALAAAMMGSNAFAGTLTVDSNASTVASELLSGGSEAVIGNTMIETSFKPSLSAGVQDGKILVTFTGGRITDASTTHYVYNVDTNQTVGKNQQLAGSTDQKLIFDVNGSINDYDELKVMSTITPNTKNDSNLSVDLNMTSTSGITLKMEILDNSDSSLDSEEASLATATAEWSVAVSSTKFDALIDAANSFKQFTDGTNTSTIDYGKITVTKNTVEKTTGGIDLNVTLYSDTDIGTFVDDINLSGSAMTRGSMSGGKYVYYGNLNNYNSATGDVNISLDTNGSTTIEQTEFTISVSSDGVVGNSSFSSNYVTSESIGQWGIYGYSAQIPNVRSSSTLTTYINITNSSSIAADAIFTIFPKLKTATTTANTSESDTCTYNAGSIPSNTQYKIDFADVLSNSDCSTAVKASANFAVELAVPTRPNDVYVNAYTKNDSINDFIVLPVYNSNTNGY